MRRSEQRPVGGQRHSQIGPQRLDLGVLLHHALLRLAGEPGQRFLFPDVELSHVMSLLGGAPGRNPAIARALGYLHSDAQAPALMALAAPR